MTSIKLLLCYWMLVSRYKLINWSQCKCFRYSFMIIRKIEYWLTAVIRLLLSCELLSCLYTNNSLTSAATILIVNNTTEHLILNVEILYSINRLWVSNYWNNYNWQHIYELYVVNNNIGYKFCVYGQVLFVFIFLFLFMFFLFLLTF